MIVDSMYGKSKIFELVSHDSHGEKPNPLEKKQCQRCRYDVAENSLLEKIKELSPNDTIKFENTTQKFSGLKVVRGNLDDCQGWLMEWS